MSTDAFPSDWADKGNVEYMNFTSRLDPFEVEDTSDPPAASHYEDSYAKILKRLADEPFETVKERAEVGDAAMRVELGIRQYCGCRTREDRAAARRIWEDTMRDGTLGESDMPAVQRAMLCLAAQCQATFADTGALDALFDAGRFANVVAGLDSDVDEAAGVLRRGARTATPVALFIAQQLARVRVRLTADAERTAFDAQTAEMPFLMDVYKRRFAAIERKNGARDARVRRKPNAFECARDGCGIAASTPGALRRCAGKCPPEEKPYYCSSECQKMDWKFHKPYCKPREGAAPSAVAVPAPVGQGTPHEGGTARRTLQMNVPGPMGQTTRLSSSTMSPAFMRDVRTAMEKRMQTAKDDDVD